MNTALTFTRCPEMQLQMWDNVAPCPLNVEISNCLFTISIWILNLVITPNHPWDHLPLFCSGYLWAQWPTSLKQKLQMSSFKLQPGSSCHAVLTLQLLQYVHSVAEAPVNTMCKSNIPNVSEVVVHWTPSHHHRIDVHITPQQPNLPTVQPLACNTTFKINETLSSSSFLASH